MTYTDERIAMLEREHRRQREEKPQTKEDRAQTYMTLKEMLEAVRAGSVVFPDNEKFSFEVRNCFEDRIPMVLVKDFYTGVDEEEGVAIFVNHDKDISQVLTVSDKELGKDSIGSWKKQLMLGMKAAGTYAEVTKEKVMENLDYLCFRTPTGKGWVYNFIFRIHTGSNRVVGNYNCLEKNKRTYGLMLEALLLRTNELLSATDNGVWRGESDYGK